MTKTNFNYLSSYSGKTVLITGHTGFKGSWLTSWLKCLGANVVGIALEPSTTPSHFIAASLGSEIQDLRLDIRNRGDLADAIIAAQPDFVFHLAAQAIVRGSYEDPLETWETNVLGTLNVLEGLRKLNKPCASVIITSDKCYENVEWVWGYRETDGLGGIDPYSASKGAAELAIRSHVRSYFPEDGKIRIASARAGNVIGGGDWSPSRIIPDCVTAWASDNVAQLRNPSSTRPWQHVLEPLSGYLNLGLELMQMPKLHGQSFNFGPQAQQNHSVLELVAEMSKYWDKVRWNDVSHLLGAPYESSLLKLNCDKSLHYLGWHAVMSFTETVSMTAEWYKFYYQNPSEIRLITNAQISQYSEFAKRQSLGWSQ